MMLRINSLSEVLCQYFNKNDELIIALIYSDQEQLCLVNLEDNHIVIWNNFWATEMLLDDINWDHEVIMKKWFYDNLMGYLDEEDDAEYIKKLKGKNVKLKGE